MHLRPSFQHIAPVMFAMVASAPFGGLACSSESNPDEGSLESLAHSLPTASHEATRLRLRFPERSRPVLEAEQLFAPRDGAFVRGLPAPGEAHWGALGVELPRASDRPIRMSLSGGFTFHVRELGREGEAAPADRAIAYRRAGGTSFWTLAAGGLEEWLHVEPGATRAGEAVATWEIDGAEVRQAAHAVQILDGEGHARVQVTAPVAYAEGGGEVAVRLVARGHFIDLIVDEPPASALLIDPLWSPAGSLQAGRDLHTATLLQDGRVLVVGGSSVTTTAKSAELYDPATNQWSYTASMVNARVFHTATLLDDGRVLVTGGALSGASATVEAYDPATATWTTLPSMSTARTRHQATKLMDGRVFITAGLGNGSPSRVASTEVFDPATNTWQPTAPLALARANHAAALLSSGEVLVTAGVGNSATHLAETEIYDPSANTWSSLPPLETARESFAAVALPGGKVLISGGYGVGTVALKTAEVFDRATSKWSTLPPMLAARAQHTATLLPTGYVLLVGGAGTVGGALATAELYSLHLGDFMGTVHMNGVRYRQTATLLQDGRVLVAGGFAAGSTMALGALLYTGPAPSACSSADHCPTGFCVDGHCCDTACGDGATDDCQACNVPGSIGQCTLLAAGTECRAATGTCDLPEVCSGDMGACPADGPAPDGTTCDDGNLCTQTDACLSGVCTGNPLACVAPDECHEASACDPQNGCGSAAKPDGTPCSLGTCQSGVCLGNGGAGGGNEGGGGADGGDSGGTGAGGEGPPIGGCGTSGSPTGPTGWLVIAAWLLLRRRPRA